MYYDLIRIIYMRNLNMYVYVCIGCAQYLQKFYNKDNYEIIIIAIYIQ